MKPDNYPDQSLSEVVNPTISPDVKNLLMGGGLGALLGGGGMAFLASKKKDKKESEKARRKRIMQQALMGAAGGAGVGAILPGMSMMGPEEGTKADPRTQTIGGRVENAGVPNPLTSLSEAAGQIPGLNFLPGIDDTGYFNGPYESTIAGATVPSAIAGGALTNVKGGIGNVLGDAARNNLTNSLGKGWGTNMKAKDFLNKLKQRGGVRGLYNKLISGGASEASAYDKLREALKRSGPAGKDLLTKFQESMKSKGIPLQGSNSLQRLMNTVSTAGKGNTAAALSKSVLKRGLKGGLAGLVPLGIAETSRMLSTGDDGFTSAQSYNDLSNFLKAQIAKQRGATQSELSNLTKQYGGPEFIKRMEDAINSGKYSKSEINALMGRIVSSLED